MNKTKQKKTELIHVAFSWILCNGLKKKVTLQPQKKVTQKYSRTKYNIQMRSLTMRTRSSSAN